MVQRYLVLCALVVGVSCSGARFDNSRGPAVSMPARLAEGSDQDAGAEVEATDSGVLRTPEPKPPSAPPDPEALRERVHWEYVLEYDRGALSVVSVKRRDFQKPTPTLRQMGRFAFELWIGQELVERVRFDFPLLGAEPPSAKRRPLKQPPTFATGATVRRSILVPDSKRATRAELVDRATGARTTLPWPPDAPLRARPVARERAADGGAHDAGLDAGDAGA